MWEEYGFPIKIEMFENGKPAGSMEYKNLVVNQVGDSEFEIPAGLKVIDAGQLGAPMEGSEG